MNRHLTNHNLATEKLVWKIANLFLAVDSGLYHLLYQNTPYY